MFKEQKGDAEQAELFALGLLNNAFGDEKRLVLVPCKHPKLCKTHSPLRIKLRMKIRQLKRKLGIIK